MSSPVSTWTGDQSGVKGKEDGGEGKEGGEYRSDLNLKFRKCGEYILEP